MQQKQQQEQQKGPNLKALGFNSPMEVIDFLALLKVEGEPIVKNDQDLLDPQKKAKAVVEYLYNEFGYKPSDLPYLASVIKHDLLNGKLRRNS